MDQDALDALIRSCAKDEDGRATVRSLRHEEIERIRSSTNLSVYEFLDAFARRVAHGYDEKKLSFEVADAAMNALNGYVLHQYDVTLPSYAEDVYAAFDAGEFHHQGDDADVDPEEKYTRPEIRSLVVRDQIIG